MHQPELKILNIDDSCTGCSACFNVCPKQCIEMNYDEEGFLYPNVDSEKCINCKQCEKVCHAINPSGQRESSIPNSFMAWTKDEILRKKSSSGGAMSLLAENILNNGGVIFGAAYNFEEKKLEHTNTTKCSIERLRKSKYMESSTGQSYAEVKDYLKQDKEVLYCGTPCQISGLYKYLGNTDSSKLLSMDFSCKGIPSNQYFNQYVNSYEQKFNENLISFDFRAKNKGWHSYSLLLNFENHSIETSAHKDLYFSTFLDSYALRKCCYKCAFRQHQSADITIADFWRIDRYKPELDDNKGVSLVVCNTQKGKETWDKVKDKQDIFCEEIPKTAFEYIYDFKGYKHLAKREKTIPQIVSKGFVAAMKDVYKQQEEKTAKKNRQRERKNKMKRSLIKLLCLFIPVKSWRKKLRESVKPAIKSDISLYYDLYDKDSVVNRRFYNIGAGGFSHPAWTNIDLKSDWYKHYDKYQTSGSINYDLFSLEPFPIGSNTAEVAYCSHVIEHITNEAAQNAFNEAFRILKKDGIFRVVVPNVDLAYRAYKENDRNYFNWIDMYSIPENYNRVKYNRPLNDASLEQIFLAHFATSASTLHADGIDNPLQDDEINKIFLEMKYEEALDYCVSKCPVEIQKKYYGNHMNWWNKDKLFEMLKKAGFSNIYLSGYRQSYCPVLRNADFFDSTRPEITLFVEAKK